MATSTQPLWEFPVFSDANPKPGYMGRIAARRASGVKMFYQNIKMHYDDNCIPDRPRPGLPTTASGIARQGTRGNYATSGLSENKKKREERQVKRQRKLRKERRTVIRVGTLKVGIMSGMGRELADMME